nr:hypothetical protein [uncultured bacterium]
MEIRRIGGMLGIVAILTLGAAACDREGPAERAGENADQAVDRAGESLDNAGDRMRDNAEDARDRLRGGSDSTD